MGAEPGCVRAQRAAGGFTGLGVSTHPPQVTSVCPGGPGRVSVPPEEWTSGGCPGWILGCGHTEGHTGSVCGVTHGWVSQLNVPHPQCSPGTPGWGWAGLEPPQGAPAVCFGSAVTHSRQMWHRWRGSGTHPWPQHKHPTRHRVSASPRRAKPRGERAAFTPRRSPAGDSFLHRVRR